jgi:hypothetical protein
MSKKSTAYLHSSAEKWRIWDSRMNIRHQVLHSNVMKTARRNGGSWLAMALAQWDRPWLWRHRYPRTSSWSSGIIHPFRLGHVDRFWGQIPSWYIIIPWNTNLLRRRPYRIHLVLKANWTQFWWREAGAWIDSMKGGPYRSFGSAQLGSVGRQDVEG